MVAFIIEDRIKTLENRVQGLEEVVEKIKKRLSKCKCLSGDSKWVNTISEKVMDSGMERWIEV